MASKIFEMIPFLRAPLLVNSSIGLILSAVDTAQLEGDWWYNDGHLFDTMSATVAFYAASLVTTALFTYTDHRRGGLKLTGGRIVVPTNLVKAAVDLSLGIALLVLHIVVCVRLGSSGRDVVLHMYAGFGALTAGIFHLILAFNSAAMALKAWKMSNNYCPTCHQRLRRCDSPAQHATEPGVEHFSFRNDRKGGESSVANRDGSLEADRLIVPAGDEA